MCSWRSIAISSVVDVKCCGVEVVFRLAGWSGLIAMHNSSSPFKHKTSPMAEAGLLTGSAVMRKNIHEIVGG